MPYAARWSNVGLPAHLTGWSLAVAGSVWLVVVVGSLGLAAAGMAHAFADPLLTVPNAVLALSGWGATASRLLLVAVMAPLLGTVAVGGLVFWRRSDDPMALLFSAAIILPFVVSSRSLLVFAQSPGWRWAIPAVTALTLVALAVTMGLFPNGRFEPRWTMWLGPATAALLIAFPQAGEVLMRMPDLPQPMTWWPTGLILGGWSVLTLAGVAAQVHRYRHVSGTIERLQTKWAMAPLGFLFTFVVLVVIVPGALLGESHSWVGAGTFAAVCLSVAVPPLLANAVLRYRLYAIDLIIRRTVTYGLVVSVLAAVYAIGVVVLTGLTSVVAGRGGSTVTVAASTLAVAALFRPVVRVVHEAVDRRFNRTGYDARRAVEIFAARLRDEVDLEQIGPALAAVAVRALQPSTAAVWLVTKK